MPFVVPLTEYVKHFSPTASLLAHDHPNQVESTVINGFGEYIMELSIGTPPFPIKAIVDTGSDLIWTQCKPCLSCYEQIDPIFDPKNSTTYKPLSCSSNQCKSLNGTCSCSSPNCHYSYDYLDQSYSNGQYAKDTLTLDSTTGGNVAFPETIVGCGFKNDGPSFRKESSGIVGLGGGAGSLVTQLGSSADGKFSYCLVPIQSETNVTSKLNFGNNALVSGAQVVSTPMIQDIDPKTFYFVTLEAISVGDTKIPFPPSSSGSIEGNVIIDSGSTLSFLPRSFYIDVEDKVHKAIGKERVDVPGGPPLCYKSTESDGDFKSPILTMHFRGADLKLEAAHIFTRASADAVCFSFAPSQFVAIYGNLLQMNFLVGYDLKKQTVSFKPTDCTKQ